MREPCFFFYCYARLQRYYKSCLLALELLLVTICVNVYNVYIHTLGHM